jgi:hypothetical protein
MWIASCCEIHFSYHQTSPGTHKEIVKKKFTTIRNGTAYTRMKIWFLPRIFVACVQKIYSLCSTNDEHVEIEQNFELL